MTSTPQAAVLSLIAVLCWSACGAGVVLQDDLQRSVSFAQSPQRIISLLPSLTETVCALGACSRLVATDRFSNWPEQVKSLPKTGGLDDAGVELIVGLKPDLVLLSRSQRLTDRLRDFGVPTFAVNSESYGDVAHTVTVIGEILGLHDRAVDLNRQIETAVHEVSSRSKTLRHGDGPAVYFEVDRAPYAAGPGSFIGELLALLGARNIVTADLGPFPKLNPEYVVRHDPDVIFVSPAEAPHLAQRPGWGEIRAVREHHLCAFGSEINDTIVRAGPRVPLGMRAMADCLQRFAP
jgi:iron complex transport system substrate-binding protein